MICDKDTLSVVDLFCGAGGFSEGFRQLGFDIVYGIDDWKPARKTFKKNFSNAEVPEETTDILKIDIDDIPDSPTVIIGGPPCTYFSTSNKGGNGDLDEGMKLVMKFFEIIKEKEPEYWIMENIPRLKKSLEEEINENDRLIGNHLKIPKRNLYVASDYGVPQKRKRLFSGDYPEPKKEDNSKNMREVLEGLPNPLDIDQKKMIEDPLYEKVSIKGKDLTDHNYNTFLTKYEWQESKRRKKRHRYYGKMRFPDIVLNGEEKEDKPARTVTASIVKSGREALIIKDERTVFDKDIENDMWDFQNGSIDESLRDIFDEEGYALSQSASISRELQKGYIIRDDDIKYLLEMKDDKMKVFKKRGHPSHFRIPTVREYASLQSFPITFQFYAPSASQRYRLAGNAVPPILARKFAKAILNNFKDERATEEKLETKAEVKEKPKRLDVDSTFRGDRKYPYNRKFADFIGEKSHSSKKGCRIDIDNHLEKKPTHPIYGKHDDSIKHVMGWRCMLYTGYAKYVDEGTRIDLDLALSILKEQEESFQRRAKDMVGHLIENGLKNIPDASTYQALWTARKKGLKNSPYWIREELTKIAKEYFPKSEYRDRIVEETGSLELRDFIEMSERDLGRIILVSVACEILNKSDIWILENWDEHYEGDDDWPSISKPDEPIDKPWLEKLKSL